MSQRDDKNSRSRSVAASPAQSFLRSRSTRFESLRPAVEVLSLPSQIHDLLEDAIIHGDIEPGSRLLPDDIALEFGVSRIPVREALSSLHEAGWVQIRPRYGAYVSQRSLRELTHLFEARAGIEPEIARLATNRRTPEDIETLRRVVKRSVSAAQADDVEAAFHASVDFNVAVRASAHNDVLAAISLALEKRARFYFYPIAKILAGDWAQRQNILVDIIESGDSALAAERARDHMMGTGEDVIRLLDLDSDN